MWINGELARRLDDELMGDQYAFTLEQLMELAGLACAQCIHRSYPTATHIVIVCGPGNNGGDGLVAARHLRLFGHQVSVIYPIQGKHPHFQRLRLQCQHNGILFFSSQLDVPSPDIIVDAIFGFSFHGEVRPPYDQLIQWMINTAAPIVSIDIPSGWDVNKGPTRGEKDISPMVLISLSMPKEGVKYYKGRHFLAGRFIPSSLLNLLNISLPTDYIGSEQYVLLSE